MAQLVRVSSGTPWEPVAAYSRAVKAGAFVVVSGTTATDERGLVIGGGQMYVQARQALLNIRAALERVGLSMQDVVRTRMFVTDISRFAEVARAHHEFFAEAPPASTMVEVTALVNPAMLIEIEADAYRESAPAAPAPGAAGTAKPQAKIAGKKTSPSRSKRRS
jgi:enamine deaminase RidA (YjgF/YER057c/UK114 family)